MNIRHLSLTNVRLYARLELDLSEGLTIVQGDKDETVPLAVAASYCAAFPDTRLVQLSGSGHFALIDPASAAWETVLCELKNLG